MVHQKGEESKLLPTYSVPEDGISSQSVIRELHFDSSSDNIDNCVNRRHVPRSAPGSRSEPILRSWYVDEMCRFFYFFIFIFFFAFIVIYIS